jgi:hypothetical protein
MDAEAARRGALPVPLCRLAIILTKYQKTAHWIERVAAERGEEKRQKGCASRGRGKRRARGEGAAGRQGRETRKEKSEELGEVVVIEGKRESAASLWRRWRQGRDSGLTIMSGDERARC